jgi:hypothetical protein
MRIINIAATGAWQAVNIPDNTVKIQVQVRADQIAATLCYAGRRTEYWTIKAGTVFEETGLFKSTTFEVMAAAGNVIEVSCQMTGVPAQ